MTIVPAERHSMQLQRYREELQELLGRAVSEHELTGLERARDVRQVFRRFGMGPLNSFEMPFDEKNSERFRLYIRRLAAANPGKIYLWTPRAFECGALLLDSLNAVNFNFRIITNAEGIAAFLTRDLVDLLLLDFFGHPGGLQRLRVEASGENWRQIPY